MKKLLLLLFAIITAFSLNSFAQTNYPKVQPNWVPYGTQTYRDNVTKRVFVGSPGYGYREVAMDSLASSKLSNSWMESESSVVSNSFHNAFPGITKDATGKLFVAYRKGTQHAIEGLGSIGWKTSIDTGKTWSSETIIKQQTSTEDYRDPSLTYLANGTIIMNYFRGTGTPDNTSLRIFTTKSTNGGTTWTTPVQLGGYATFGAVSAPIVQLANGNLVMPTYGNDGGTYKCLVFRSTNNGDSWTSIGTMATGGAYVEPNFILLPDGRLMGSIRNESTTKIAINYSSDGGVTWTSPVDKFDGQSRTTLALSGNNVVFSYRSWDGATKSYPALRISSDYGVTFPFPETNLPMLSGADNYSAITKISGNTFAFIYSIEETGTKAPIYFRKLSFPISAGILPGQTFNGLITNNGLTVKKGGIKLADNTMIQSVDYQSTGWIGLNAGQNGSYGAGIKAYGYNSPTAKGKLVLGTSTGKGQIVFSAEGVIDTTGFAVFDRNGDLTLRTGRMYLPLAAVANNEPLRLGEFNTSLGSYMPKTAGLGVPFTGNVALTESPAAKRYIVLTGGTANTGSLAIQAGPGSASFGGMFEAFGHSNASFPGWVKASISNGSGGKFGVNANGGSDVFTVDANGNTVANGKSTVALAPTNPTDVVRKTELDLKSNLAGSNTFTGTNSFTNAKPFTFLNNWADMNVTGSAGTGVTFGSNLDVPLRFKTNNIPRWRVGPTYGELWGDQVQNFIGVNTLDGQENGALTLSGANKGSNLSGGSISVYGRRYNFLNPSYASDVHIFGGKDGQVWLGATRTTDSLSQDVIGIFPDLSANIYWDLRLHRVNTGVPGDSILTKNSALNTITKRPITDFQAPLTFNTNDFDNTSNTITIDYLNAQKASITNNGLVSNTTQTFEGYKNFNRPINIGGFNGGFKALGLGSSGGGYPAIGSNMDLTSTGGEYRYSGSDPSSQILFDAGGLRFKTAASGTAGNVISYTERFAITNAGNVQIPGAAAISDDVLTLKDVSIVNTTTAALSKIDLNNAYPNVVVGFRVICHLISGGPVIYTKATENGSTDVWLTSTQTTTP